MNNSQILFFIILSILIAYISRLLGKVGQPALLGEILGGAVIASLGLYITYFQNLANNQSIAFLGELGGVFLLFEIGLESDLYKLKAHAIYATLVAIVGALIPFVSGYLFAKYFIGNTNEGFCLFFAATLAATSTGISVRIFKEYKLTQTLICQVVLAASVIDDILSLIILTVITVTVTTGHLSMMALISIPVKLILFFLGLYFFIKHILPKFYKKQDSGSSLVIIIAGCFISSWLAHMVGMSSIIGAFLAGLFIDKTYMKNKYQLIYPFTWLLVPIFFIYSGLQFDIRALLDPSIVELSIIFSLIAIITKIIPIFLIPNNRITFIQKLTIGVGMVPRGEIGIIIALMGKELGILSTYYFNVVTLMVIITSIVCPILLNIIIKKANFS